MEGSSKRVRITQGPRLGTEFGPQQELMEEVAETNWLLRQMWRSVEGVRHQTRRMAEEMERAEVQRELEGLREEADQHREDSSEDSESSGSWRTDSEETEERSSERWRSTVDLDLEPEREREVEEVMTLQ